MAPDPGTGWLSKLAADVWAHDHAGARCPPDMISPVADLAAWLPECRESARLDALDRCGGPGGELVRGDLAPAPAREGEPVRLAGSAAPTESMAGVASDGATIVLADTAIPTERLEVRLWTATAFDMWLLNGKGADKLTADEATYGIERIHARWVALPHDHSLRTKHPLAPIVRAWQNRTLPVKPHQPRPTASLPRLDRAVADDSTLPGFPGADAPPAPGGQLALPGFEPAVTACPSWLLWLYDRAGGKSMTQGRGVPWDLHMFVSAFLHLPITERTGNWHTIRIPHLIEHEADWPVPGTASIERWLFPDGWDRKSKQRDWDRLPEALQRMKSDLGYVPVNGGSVALVFPSAIPESRDFPMVEFTIRVPSAAAQGARVNWDMLRRYRLKSAALYRGYLSACAVIDHSAHRGQGITAQIGAPMLRPDGKPKRRKGGAVVRSKTELIPNRHAHFVPTLDTADLARLIGLDAGNKRRRHDAVRAFERLSDDGVIELRREAGGWRIFAPSPHGG